MRYKAMDGVCSQPAKERGRNKVHIFREQMGCLNEQKNAAAVVLRRGFYVKCRRLRCR